MRAHYAPNSVVVAAAGNLDHDRFVELVDGAVRRLRGRVRVAASPKRPRRTPGAHIRHKDSEQAYVVLGTRGLIRSRRSPVRALGARHDSRRRHVEPAVSRRFARSAAWSTASTRFKRPIAARDCSASTRARRPENVQSCIDLIVARVRPRLATSRSADDELQLAQGAHQRQPDAVAGVDVEPDDPAWAQRVCARADVTPEEIEQRDRRGHRPRSCGARARVLDRRELWACDRRPGRRVDDRVGRNVTRRS